MVNILDIIDKKRYGGELNKEEIDYFISAYTKGELPDYQISSLLMAICINGMTFEETFNLTDAMLHSGDQIDLSSINGQVLDKHSTGGVGDSTSLALAPILAALGQKVAKMSGRGLGITGGTIDKLESIPGCRTDLSEKEFFDIVNKVGCSIIGQTKEVCPADKKLYALRDVTGTVACFPLIASSIMCKKIASGAKTILLDVKCGSGAFMKTVEDASTLANIMVKIGTMFNRNVGALITDMSQPLSMYCGNSIEVIGAIEVLDGLDTRLAKEVKEVAKKLLVLAGVYKTENEALLHVEEVINNGQAKQKFMDMIASQGGDISYLKDTSKFEIGKPYNVLAKEDGYVKKISTDDIGQAIVFLGGGRLKKTDIIDNSVGIKMNKSLGDKVNKGDVLLTIFHNGKGLNEAIELTSSAFEISSEKPEEEKIAFKYITKDGEIVY